MDGNVVTPNKHSGNIVSEPTEIYNKLEAGEINQAYGSEQKYREAIEKTEQFVNRVSEVQLADRGNGVLFDSERKTGNKVTSTFAKILPRKVLEI